MTSLLVKPSLVYATASDAGNVDNVVQNQFTIEGQYMLMTKEQFKDWLLHKQFTRNIKLIQEHHTWSPSYKDFNGSNYLPLLKWMERYHVNVMHWNNISQNLTIFPDGEIVVCRPLDSSPQGSIGLENSAARRAIESKSITIENLGNFDEGNDVMTPEQKDAIVYVTALLCIKFGLTPSINTITYHHWWDLGTGQRVLDRGQKNRVKTCPGTGFFGGNSTTSAKANFYPLVLEQMKQIEVSMH